METKALIIPQMGVRLAPPPSGDNTPESPENRQFPGETGGGVLPYFDRTNAVEKANPDAHPGVVAGVVAVGLTKKIRGRTHVGRVCPVCSRDFWAENRKGKGVTCSRKCRGKYAKGIAMEVARQTVPESDPAERLAANDLVLWLLRFGGWKRAEACETCGKVGKTDAHHRDYAQPDVVAWLCRSCHMAEHQRPFGPRKYPVPTLKVRPDLTDRYWTWVSNRGGVNPAHAPAIREWRGANGGVR